MITKRSHSDEGGQVGCWNALKKISTALRKFALLNFETN